MSIFNLFGKKEEDNGRIFKDVVWIDTAAKNQGLLKRFAEQPATLFVAWFAEDAAAFRAFGVSHGIPETQVKLYRELTAQQVKEHPVVFLQHHPVHQKELDLANELQLASADVYGAMDEPIFILFGSEKMMPLVKMLGFKSDEPIVHSYVTASVTKAQEKIGSRVVVEQSAQSLAEWLRKNYRKNEA